MDPNVLLAAQCFATALIAGWLSIGVWDNIQFPSVNETYTAQVVSMARLQEDFPEEYAQVAHRAVTDRRWQTAMFRAVVAAEVFATALLWLGVITLLMALVGTRSVEAGKTIAMLGTMSFTAIWAAFLIVGNYFCYWFCHEGAQNTHYQMTLWGVGTMVFLSM